MTGFAIGLKLALSISTIAFSGNILASSMINPNHISSQDRALISDLKTCVKNAIEQGMSTSAQISDQCQQQADALENEVPGLAKVIIDKALS